MTYYMLECFEPIDWPDSAMLGAPSVDPPDDLSWSMGRRFADPLPEPIEIGLLATHADRLLELYNEGPLVMTSRLLHALVAAGVDNLDVYRTIIRHPVTGLVTTDYVAANLVGLVAASDLGRSTVVGGSADGLLDVDFDGVVLDEARIGDLLMFRLAESTNAVVVHERVRSHLLRSGFDMLTFVPPEEWMG
jgi:hypothetical protein